MDTILRRIASAIGKGRKLYRIACIYEDGPDIQEAFWRRWPSIFDAADGLVRILPEPCSIRSIQYDPVLERSNEDDDELGLVTRFRKLGWNEKNNRKWVDDLAGRQGFQLDRTELWSPWYGDLEDRRFGGPHLYAKIDAAEPSEGPDARAFGWQSFTLAIRHDQLPRAMAAAQRLIDRAAELMPASKTLIFDRAWGEHGGYTRFIRINGLEDSYPHMLEDWLVAHPAAAVPAFDEAGGGAERADL